MDRGGKLANIQALRGIAALMVVALHAISRGTAMGHDLGRLTLLTPWGEAGVDLFFVISGFIMVHIHETRPRGPTEFIANRIRRIVPLYWALLATVVLATTAGLLAPWNEGAGQPWTSFLFVSRALSGEDPILFVGWTLEYEAFFYLCFAAAIAFAGRAPGAMYAIVALLVGVPVMTGWIDPIALEFLYGMAIGYLWRRRGDTSRSGLVLLVVGGALLLASLGRDDVKAWRALVYGVPAAMILLGALWTRARAGRMLTWLGEISYSLYLSHVYVIAFLYAWATDDVSQGFVLTIVIACVVVGAGVHRWVEQPLAGMLAGRRTAYSQRRLVLRKSR